MVGRKSRRGWGAIRRMRSKRYQASYLGPDGAYHHAATTFENKALAERWLDGERHLIECNNWETPAARTRAQKGRGVTVGGYATTWIDQRPLKPSTEADYRRILAKHIGPRLGAMPIKTLTAEAVRAWYASLRTAAPSVRVRAYGLLKAICSTAVLDELIGTNPCSIKDGARYKTNREPATLAVSEVAALADAIAPELRAAVLIGAWCGLRFGEYTELRRGDISEGAVQIQVSRAATHPGACIVSTPKSGLGRTVTVPRHIRADILEHLRMYTGPQASALLFTPSRGGCHLLNPAFRAQFRKALKAVGREGVRVHDLRHFCGTQVAAVSSLRETMDFLGHSSVTASLIYQHAAAGRGAEIAESLSRAAEAAAVGK